MTISPTRDVPAKGRNEVGFDEQPENHGDLWTYPWNIPQTPNQQFMKEFLSSGGLGIPGVCSKGMLGFS